MQVEIDERELGTVLAALRHWQDSPEVWGLVAAGEMLTHEEGGLFDIATDSGRFDALSPEEVDALCERINTDQVLRCPECGTELRIFCSYTGFEYYVAQVNTEGTVVGPLLSRDNDEWKARSFQCPKCEWEERFQAHLRAIAQGGLGEQQREAGENGPAGPRRVQGAGRVRTEGTG